jgi:organic hydroperoxide reductase OsmC/OhrA
MKVSLRGIAGTEAALGWAGTHAIVVDRPQGRAGGQGLGFNGGQLLALAIGGCLCNDLYYVAHAMDVRLTSVSVDVVLTLSGEPLLATGAEVAIAVETADLADDVDELIRRAKATSTVSNSIARGVDMRVDGRGATSSNPVSGASM